MPFANFQKLSASHKREKLIYAFAKIILRADKDSWIFRCCRNMFAVRELYLDLLDMMCNIRSFAISLLEDDEIESRPACYMHEPHERFGFLNKRPSYHAKCSFGMSQEQRA